MVVVTSADVENYRFLRLYSIDLDIARQTCDLLDRQDSLELRYCLLRDLVVTYARPFSRNRGRVHRNHHLREKVIPESMLPLHRELITLRDQAFAHTDHDFRNPQISRWAKSGGGGLYTLGFSNPAYEVLNSRSREIRELVIAVDERVSAMGRELELLFDQLYPKEKQT